MSQSALVHPHWIVRREFMLSEGGLLRNPGSYVSPSHQFTEVYQFPDTVQPALSGRGPSDLTVTIGACLMWTPVPVSRGRDAWRLSRVDVGLVSLSKKSLATTPIGNGVMPTPQREVVA